MTTMAAVWSRFRRISEVQRPLGWSRWEFEYMGLARNRLTAAMRLHRGRRKWELARCVILQVNTGHSSKKIWDFSGGSSRDPIVSKSSEGALSTTQGHIWGRGPGLVTSPSFFSGVQGSALDQTTKASPWSENLQTFFGWDTNCFF